MNNINKKRFLIAILGICLILMNLIASAETNIRFAVTNYPPFIISDNSQELLGFEIEIARKACEKIGAKCTFTNDKLKNMIPSLENGSYDAWISAITINKKRKKYVAFTKPTFSSTAGLLAKSSTIFSASPKEIKGKTIGVKAHTCYIDHLKKIYGNSIKIKTFATKRDCYLALKNGDIDAIIDDSHVLRHWRTKQQNHRKYRIAGLPAKFSKLVWHKYGIAVAKDNQGLVNLLNKAITSMKKDGTYKKIVKKYF